MLNRVPITRGPLPNPASIELASNQLRIPPEQARHLNLQSGQIVKGQVTVQGDVRTLSVDGQQLTLPPRVALPIWPISLQVKIADGSTILTRVDLADIPQNLVKGRALPLPLVLTSQQGRALGLIAGQVVQVFLTRQNGETIVSVGNRSINLPDLTLSYPRTLNLRVFQNDNNFILSQPASASAKESIASLAYTNLPIANDRQKSPRLVADVVASLRASQALQLGLQPGRRIAAILSHSVAGSRLEFPRGSLLLPRSPATAISPVHLKIVGPIHSARSGVSEGYFLTPYATDKPASALLGSLFNASRQPRIPINAGYAKQLFDQQGSIVEARINSAGPIPLLELGDKKFNLPKGFTITQSKLSLDVEQKGANYILKIAQPYESAKNNHSGGAKMLTAEPMNLSMRPNIVYVEGAAAGMRINPEQARTLGLREGQVINAVVAQRAESNLLLVGNKKLQMPPGLNFPKGPLSLLVSVVNGNMLLSLVDQSSANKFNQRADADARFGRLLGHPGGLHLSRLFSPTILNQTLGSAPSVDFGQILRGMLMNSREISGASIRRSLENFGLFTESEIRNGGLTPGNQTIKSALIGLRALFQSRQLDNTLLSGAIDEVEARQIESLAQQVSGKTSLSWVIPFGDQLPVYIRLSQEHAGGDGDSDTQEKWSVDFEVGLDAQTSMSANIKVNVAKQIEVQIWLPSADLYSAAQSSRDELIRRLGEAGVTTSTLNIFPTSRIPITDDVPEQRVGIKIDA